MTGAPPREILVVGAGIAGIACALALSRELTPFVPDLKITVFERHEVLSTSGGAINLTPVAQRHLSQLGVLQELDRMGTEGGADVDAIELFSLRSGRALGSIGFTDRQGNGFGGFKGRRVMRIVLSVAMLAVVERTHNVSVVFGKKLVRAAEEGGNENSSNSNNSDDDGDHKHGHVTLHFEDGTSATGDLVLGCDGVHSATRTQIVDPQRPSEYTGLAYIQTTMSADSLSAPLHFRSAAMNVSGHGSLLTSYCDRDRQQIFIAAIVQFDEKRIRDHHRDKHQDWRVQDAIRESLGNEVRDRFGRSGLPCVREMVNKRNTDWMLYPVYQVRPGGKWHAGRALLLGDAAHGMPPRDESAAFALDDAIIFARILVKYRLRPLHESFQAYEDFRRETVNRAFEASWLLWEQNRDMGSLEARLREWTLPKRIRKQCDARESAWVFDATKVDLPAPDDQPESLYSFESSTKSSMSGG